MKIIKFKLSTFIVYKNDLIKYLSYDIRSIIKEKEEDEKQLVTFKISDGGHEYESYGVYDHKYSDERIIKDFFSIDEMQEDYLYEKIIGGMG